LVDIEKTVMAIEEKKRWEKREEEILEELERVRDKRKKLKKEAKKLKEQIRKCKDSLVSMQKDKRRTSESSIDLIEEIKRM